MNQAAIKEHARLCKRYQESEGGITYGKDSYKKPLYFKKQKI